MLFKGELLCHRSDPYDIQACLYLIEFIYVFACSHIGGDDQQESSIGITVKDFKGAGVVVYVAKRPDMKSAQLLSGDEEANTGKEEEKNLWDSLSR